MIIITLTIPIIIAVNIMSLKKCKYNVAHDNGNNRDSLKESGWQVSFFGFFFCY